MWGWIKRWFDPGTTSKIFILSAAEVKPTLTSFMDPSSIPKHYGGELDWQWGDMPNLDEPAQEKLQGIEQAPAEGKTKKEMMKGPMLFKGDEIEVLGTVNGKERRETIPVPKTEQNGESNEKADVVSNPPENEKTGIDTVNVNQVDELQTQTQTTTAAA